MSKIVELSNKDGSPVYPISMTDAIYDKNGKTVTEVMSTMVYASDKDIVIPAQEKINADMLNSRPASYYVNQDTIVDIEKDIDLKVHKFETILDQKCIDVDVLESRMDTFTALKSGSTTGDAELQDIRVKSDGSVAATAGDAVRDQIRQLSDEKRGYKNPRGKIRKM